MISHSWTSASRNLRKAMLEALQSQYIPRAVDLEAHARKLPLAGLRCELLLCRVFRVLPVFSPIVLLNTNGSNQSYWNQSAKGTR